MVTVSGDRDYGAEVRALIDAEADPTKGPYVARVVAEKIVAGLRETDPALLRGWLDEQAETAVWRLIQYRDCSWRSHQRATGGRSVFGRAARAFEAGEAGALGGWLAVPFLVERDERKALGQLTAPDLIYVADHYQRRAAGNAFEATFFRALAEKVGKGVVSDCFTDEQITELRESIDKLK